MSALAIDPALQLAARIGLALLFGSAALHKLRDVAAFRAALEGYELIPPVWAVPAGALLIAGELGIAAGLCLTPSAPAAGLAAAWLLGIYAGAIAINLWRGRRDIDCGCAGPGRRQPLGAGLVVRNAILAVVALLVVVPDVPRSLGWLDAVTVAAAVASLALLYVAAEGLYATHTLSREGEGRVRAIKLAPIFLIALTPTLSLAGEGESSALLVSTVVLWIAVVVLAAVVFALVRQVGVLHERVAPAGALVGREEPRVGEPAPRLSLHDWAGRPIEIGAPHPDGRATLLLFVSPTCPVCKTLLPIADSVRRAEGGTRLVLASDGPRAEHEAFVRAHGPGEAPYVLSAGLGHAYQVGKLPYAALIDGGGILRGRGLVNTREHLESLFEAMRLRSGTIQEHVLANRMEGAALSAPFGAPSNAERGGDETPPSKVNGGLGR